MDRVCYYLDNYLNYSESLATTLLLIKYIFKYNTSSSNFDCEKAFKRAIEKYGFFEDEIKSLERGVD